MLSEWYLGLLFFMGRMEGKMRGADKMDAKNNDREDSIWIKTR